MGLTAHLVTALFDCSSGPHELWCHSEVCLVPGSRESGGHCKELVRSHKTDTLSCGISLLSLPLSFSCHLSPVVSKASSGAMELMQVYSVSSMTTFLKVGMAMVVLSQGGRGNGCLFPRWARQWLSFPNVCVAMVVLSQGGCGNGCPFNSQCGHGNGCPFRWAWQ